MSNNESKPNQTITVNDRKSISINSVINVLNFDETYVCVMTELGKVIVEGEDLKIESLGKDEGVIYVIGTINGVYYPAVRNDKHSVFKIFK